MFLKRAKKEREFFSLSIIGEEDGESLGVEGSVLRHGDAMEVIDSSSDALRDEGIKDESVVIGVSLFSMIDVSE